MAAQKSPRTRTATDKVKMCTGKGEQQGKGVVGLEERKVWKRWRRADYVCRGSEIGKIYGDFINYCKYSLELLMPF